MKRLATLLMLAIVALSQGDILALEHWLASRGHNVRVLSGTIDTDTNTVIAECETPQTHQRFTWELPLRTTGLDDMLRKEGHWK